MNPKRLLNRSARRICLPSSGGGRRQIGAFEELELPADAAWPELEPWLRERILVVAQERQPSGMRGASAFLRKIWRTTEWLRRVVTVGLLLLACSAGSTVALLSEMGRKGNTFNLWSVLLAAVPGLLFLAQERRSRGERQRARRRLAAQISPRGIPIGKYAPDADGRRDTGDRGLRVLLQLLGWSAAISAYLARVVLPTPHEGGLGVAIHLLQPRGTGHDAFVPAALFGSYMLTAYLFKRGFTRGSLTVDMFGQAVLRSLLTLLFASILKEFAAHAVQNGYQSIVGFAIGFWPALGLEALTQAGAKAVPSLGAKRRSDDVSLRSLIDIDHLSQARLEECGIETASDLAGVDPVAMIKRSHLPPKGLMSAIDQALLLSRADESALKELRNLGVISATDLIALYRSDDALPEAARLPRRFLALALLLESDPNVRQVIRWRAYTGDRELVAHSVQDFELDPADHWCLHTPERVPGSGVEPREGLPPASAITGDPATRAAS